MVLGYEFAKLMETAGRSSSSPNPGKQGSAPGLEIGSSSSSGAIHVLAPRAKKLVQPGRPRYMHWRPHPRRPGSLHKDALSSGAFGAPRKHPAYRSSPGPGRPRRPGPGDSPGSRSTPNTRLPIRPGQEVPPAPRRGAHPRRSAPDRPRRKKEDSVRSNSSGITFEGHRQGSGKTASVTERDRSLVQIHEGAYRVGTADQRNEA